MKVVKTFVILFLLGFIGYEHSEPIIDQAKIYIDNPADYVLNANVPADEIVYTFDRIFTEKIFPGPEARRRKFTDFGHI